MNKEVVEKRIKISEEDYSRELFGDLDSNVKTIEKEFDVDIAYRENDIIIIGNKENVNAVGILISKLVDIIKNKKTLTDQELAYTIQLVQEGNGDLVKELINDVMCTTYSGKQIKPKTIGQKRYIEAMKNKDVVFSIGPAGTGKTYLAVAMAVNAFKNKEVSRIILTRPAVEAGEKLGFLPGDLQDKVDPYLRPLNDALFDVLGGEAFAKHKERGSIEIAPLAYMRGRTLDSAFVILDEAQNTTSEQMKMFLTRLGFGSKAVITGDITQIDLPNGKTSGLKQITKILKGVEGIDFITLSKSDVVRHQLVKRIIEAYEKFEDKQK
ncbi:PhoH family protein [Clostridiaceae bacterium M8S5]|nr:PhoH family protein [Clostridiaceae bacterium M8S5]